MVVHACPPSTLGLEVGGSEFQDHLQLHNEFKANLGYKRPNNSNKIRIHTKTHAHYVCRIVLLVHRILVWLVGMNNIRLLLLFCTGFKVNQAAYNSPDMKEKEQESQLSTICLECSSPSRDLVIWIQTFKRNILYVDPKLQHWTLTLKTAEKVGSSLSTANHKNVCIKSSKSSTFL